MEGNTHGHQPDTTIQSNDWDRKQKKQGHKEPKKPETCHHCEQAHSNWVVEEFQEGQGSQHWSI